MHSVSENTAVASLNLSRLTLRRLESDPATPALPRATKRRSLLRRTSSLSLCKFSPLASTEVTHSTTEEKYYGPYAHLRRELDYTYHSHYRKERQWLQDSIIEDILDNVDDPSLCVTPTEPWLVFTVGPRGAGKKHVCVDLVSKGRLPLLGFISVNPDEIRRRLPEFNTYSRKSPMRVDELTRKESGYIAEILMLAALQAGRNVVVDGVMRDAKWHLRLIEKLRDQYSALKIAVIEVTSPRREIINRNLKNSIDTKREIPPSTTDKELEAIAKSLILVKPYLDFYCQIHNGKDSYGLVGPTGEASLNDTRWDLLQTTFLQICAWKPGMNGKQRLDRRMSREESLRSIQSSVRKRRRRRRRFSVLISSEENNRSDQMKFHGKYSHIRKTLDYNYHANYTLERQHLQDAIISDMLDEAVILDTDGNLGSVPTEPWIVFTAGAMGAGKSHTMNVLVEKGRFPLKAFVIVDPDEIRRLLPEYHIYIDENPELAGELTRKEAGFIAEILTLAALQAGKNVLQDGSLRDSDWYKTYFQRLKNEFPSVRQAILHVTAPREAVFQRAAERAMATGRIVPRDVLENALEQVPRSVNILAPLVDYYAELNNATEVELTVPKGANWDQFKSQWHQKIAYVPNRRKFFEKAKEVCDKKQIDVSKKETPPPSPTNLTERLCSI